MKNSQITTFIFDCFGVLLDPVLVSWYKTNSAKYGFVDETLMDTLRRFDLGELSENDMVEHFLKYPGVRSTPEKIREELDNTLKLDETVAATIDKLKQFDAKTVLLSNANHSFFERKVYPTYPKFKGHFDEIVISSAVKMVKPDKDIYLYTLAKINSKPEECLFIDDSKVNVTSALELGMKGYLYTNSKSFTDYIVQSGIVL